MPRANRKYNTAHYPSGQSIFERAQTARQSVKSMIERFSVLGVEIIQKKCDPLHKKHLLEEWIELGVLILDELDGNPDMEDGGDAEDGGDDEPSIGGGYVGDVDREQDDCDDEPNLGWRNPMGEEPAKDEVFSRDLEDPTIEEIMRWGLHRTAKNPKEVV